MRKLTRRNYLMLAVVLVLILGAIFGLWLSSRDSDQKADRAETGKAEAVEDREELQEVAEPLAARVLAICEAGGPAARELRAIGACPVAEDVTEVVEGQPGPPGEPGPPGPPPSAGQVAAAVAAYCEARGDCQGPRGDQPSAAQVAQAVATYCDARGLCRGPAGEAGEDGATGAQGPPPSGEQVAAAVASYCSTRNECRGEQGQQGPRGEPGVSVTGAAAECQEGDPFPTDDVVVFTFTFSEGPDAVLPVPLPCG